jgi:hypothetical protein
MTSTSAIVNRSLRATVSPLLCELGFEKVDARNGWRWLDKVIWVFNIRAVGSYFSDVTGWPPGSLGVWLGAYYTFMPRDLPIKVDDHGRLVPPEHVCQMRTHLDRGLQQEERTSRLRNPAERLRTDIWWVEPDGSNAATVAADIADSLRSAGAPWFTGHSDLGVTLTEVDGERDCFVKFDRAALLAREIRDQDRLRRYAALATTEAARSGRPNDGRARYGV